MWSSNPLHRVYDFILGKLIYALPLSARRALFAGDQHLCPVCHSKLRKFIVLYRPYHLWCPVCASLQRHRLVWLFLESEQLRITQIKRRMLHFAPEPAISARLAALDCLDYVSADLYDPHATLKMDVCDIRFPDGSFDLIYCSHVLEHIPDDAQALREFWRVLKPGGEAVIIVPILAEITDEDATITDPKERLARFGQVDHVRVYGRDFQERLVTAGFSVKEYKTADLAQGDEITRFGLAASESIFYCKKAS